jgi:hypothetical protein
VASQALKVCELLPRWQVVCLNFVGDILSEDKYYQVAIGLKSGLILQGAEFVLRR